MTKNIINIGIPSKGRLRKDILKIFKKNKLNLVSERGERDLFGFVKDYKNVKNTFWLVTIIIDEIPVLIESNGMQEIVDNIPALTEGDLGYEVRLLTHRPGKICILSNNKEGADLYSVRTLTISCSTPDLLLKKENFTY